MIISSQSDQNPKSKPIKKNSTSALDGTLQYIEKPQDESFNELRPKSFEQYIGQERIIRQLNLIIQSSKIRDKLPEHMLFYGQPGLGKTTLANLISVERGLTLKTVAAPALQKIGDVVSLFLNIEANSVIFIDEIHRLKAPLEETLYTALEDGVIDIVMGKGHGATSARIDLNPFILVGATTQLGKVSKPLKDRFPTIFHLEPYSESDILALIERNISILNLKMSEEAKLLVCRRCRGVPRIANNILKRFVDLQTVHSIHEISKVDALEFFEELGIFERGLTKADIKYLTSLENSSMSLKTLSGILLEEQETIELVVEPYLIHLGFVNKSSEGRMLTLKGRDFVKSYHGIEPDGLL